MNSPDLGEQAISQAAKLGLETQLDDVENLDVTIRSNPLDLLQGKVDSVSVEGDGLVMQKELRAEKLKIETNSISINSLKAAMGNIELTRPTDARMMVILKEEDLQNAFNSEYIKDKLQNIEINCEGENLTVKIVQSKLNLLDDGKIELEADSYLVEKDSQEKIYFTAIPKVNNDGNCINLDSVEYLQDQKYNEKVAKAIIDSAEEILDLRNFELDTMSLQIRKLDVKSRKLMIEAEAEIVDFPNAS